MEEIGGTSSKHRPGNRFLLRSVGIAQLKGGKKRFEYLIEEHFDTNTHFQRNRNLTDSKRNDNGRRRKIFGTNKQSRNIQK